MSTRITLLSLVAAFFLGCVGHKTVHAELVIPASPDRVWAVITDGASYGEWNPILVSAKGEFVEGGTILYEMKNPEGEVYEVDPIVRKVVPERELNQFGGTRGVLTFDHTWLIEPVEAGSKVTQHEEYRGIGVFFWDPAWVEDAYEAGLVALRDRLATP